MWSVVLPGEKLHQDSKFDNHLQVSQSLQSGRKFFRGRVTRSPSICVPIDAFDAPTEPSFQGMPTATREEGEACTVLLL